MFLSIFIGVGNFSNKKSNKYLVATNVVRYVGCHANRD